MDKPQIICVEGNIGAGKSTLLPQLATALNATAILEPVDSDPEFQHLLGEFTRDPFDVTARSNFQCYITAQRAELLNNLNPKGVYIIERSLLSDLVFTHACIANYNNTAEDIAKHMACYQHLISQINQYPTIDYCIYLKTDPKVAYQRMRQRGRVEEMGLDLGYISDIDAFHDAVLPQACRKMGTKLIYIDWNQPSVISDLLPQLNAAGLVIN
ncbi:deoxynucleoside kinase [Photobacterium andalusiense]|uniref:Deoxyadenosine/deoxycytidine kinase n=1 Tax=Photobacterium andalusiense TaxID=2204296 RepID=A0A1Y6MFN7_9GAMM|nr:deoxynucleoside kinase [Photobacterium andalusiense]SMY35282.1 Deoxyadenosine/deoxycytidine kinase [Photobacterium andalusiense]